MAKSKMVTVEESLQELEAILDTLRDENTTLEQSIELYARAADLIAKSDRRRLKWSFVNKNDSLANWENCTE